MHDDFHRADKQIPTGSPSLWEITNYAVGLQYVYGNYQTTDC